MFTDASSTFELRPTDSKHPCSGISWSSERRWRTSDCRGLLDSASSSSSSSSSIILPARLSCVQREEERGGDSLTAAFETDGTCETHRSSHARHSKGTSIWSQGGGENDETSISVFLIPVGRSYLACLKYDALGHFSVKIYLSNAHVPFHVYSTLVTRVNVKEVWVALLPLQLGCMGFPVVSAAVMSAISPSLFLGEFIFVVFLNGFASVPSMTME